MEFSKDLDDLLKIFNSSKHKIVQFLKRNFKENTHYVIREYNKIPNGKRGGHNKVKYFLTEEAYELTKNSFNLKHRYLKIINSNCSHINLLMSLENQTIGFIENSFKNIEKMKRQQNFGSYKVDLYFENHNLIVECDENNHSDRDAEYEKNRENFLLSEGNSIIRYDPNHKKFDLSLVLIISAIILAASLLSKIENCFL